MPRPLGLVGEAVGWIEAHRLLVQQGAREELRPVVHPEPGGLVGEQSEGRAVGLREAEAGEALDHLPDALWSSCLVRAGVRGGAFDEALAVARSIATLARLRLIARRRPSASPGPEPGEGLGDLEHPGPGR